MFKQFFLCFALFSSSLLAIGQPADQDDQDPFRNINYAVAFDPAINHEHADVLRALGITENAIGQHVIRPTPSCLSPLYRRVKALAQRMRSTAQRERLHDEEEAVRAPTDPMEVLKSAAFQNYVKARLAQLASARRTAVLQPAKAAGQIAVFFILGGGLTALALGPDSFAGGFGALIAIVDPMYQAPTILKSLNRYLTPRGHVLDALEKRYAETQCFIPHELWPYIHERFMLARQNIMAQAVEVERLRFVLGLTLHYPRHRPAVPDLGATLSRIETQIDAFFANYEGTPPDDVFKIKASVRNFVLTLLKSPRAIAPRNLYFQGKGGIGKTHFMKFLSELINKEVGDFVLLVSDIIVMNGADLEGDKDSHGIFLDVLQRMCASNKQGAIVLMDEVDLNQPHNAGGLENAAKRVFNGPQSTLPARCFGQGVELARPCTLTAMGSNKSIQDPALASRFTVVNMGMPKKSALLSYAKQIFLQESGLTDIPAAILPHLETMVAQELADNFRFFEENVPPLAQRHREKKLKQD